MKHVHHETQCSKLCTRIERNQILNSVCKANIYFVRNTITVEISFRRNVFSKSRGHRNHASVESHWGFDSHTHVVFIKSEEENPCLPSATKNYHTLNILYLPYLCRIHWNVHKKCNAMVLLRGISKKDSIIVLWNMSTNICK